MRRAEGSRAFPPPPLRVLPRGARFPAPPRTAARLGPRVALVHNRPVPGGNSSSEARVWVCGATAHGAQRWARETGIIGELILENQYRDPEGNPHHWDQVVLDALFAEPNLTLFLNTDVREVTAEGPAEERTITSVTGWTMGSERLITFTGPVFLDCTGDGLIGHLAGTGAALCVRDGAAPREPAADRRLQQVLLRHDASLVGVRNTDPDDLARTARVSASSTLSVPAVEPGPGTEPFPLDRDLGVVLPVEPSLEGFELLVDAAAATTLRGWNRGTPSGRRTPCP